MAEIKLQLPEDEMKAFMTASILGQLSEEARTAIIAQAVAWLTATPERTTYGPRDPQSPLETAFRTAMASATHAVVRDMIENDAEVRGVVEGELRKLVREFAAQLSEEQDAYGELRAAMTGAMISHLAAKKAEEYR